MQRRSLTIFRQLQSLGPHEQKFRWTCPFSSCDFAGKLPAEIQQHIASEHTAENVSTDYEWQDEHGAHVLHPDSTNFVKLEEDGCTIPRSHVVGHDAVMYVRQVVLVV